MNPFSGIYTSITTFSFFLFFFTSQTRRSLCYGRSIICLMSGNDLLTDEFALVIFPGVPYRCDVLWSRCVYLCVCTCVFHCTLIPDDSPSKLLLIVYAQRCYACARDGTATRRLQHSTRTTKNQNDRMFFNRAISHVYGCPIMSDLSIELNRRFYPLFAEARFGRYPAPRVLLMNRSRSVAPPRTYVWISVIGR